MTKSKITPLADKVVLRLIGPPDKVGLIHLPQNRQVKPQKGEVLAVGPDCKNEPGYEDRNDAKYKRVKPGQVVLFNQYAGTTSPDDETILIIREDELLGVIG